jgi:hypothetical protein
VSPSDTINVGDGTVAWKEEEEEVTGADGDEESGINSL